MRAVLYETIHGLFLDRSVLRVELIVVSVLAFVALLAWPSGAVPVASAFDQQPATASIVLFAAVLGTLFLALNLAVENTRPESMLTLEDWTRHGSVGVPGLVAGRTFGMLAHTVFLTALPVPIVLVSAAVSGVPPQSVFRSFALLGAMALAYRLYGFLLLSFPRPGRFAINLMLWSPVVYLFLVTPTTAPRINPIVGFLAILGRTPAATIDLPVDIRWVESLYFHLGVSGAFLVLTTLNLLRVRAGYRARSGRLSDR